MPRGGLTGAQLLLLVRGAVMTYEHVVSQIVKVVEAVGVTIMIVGGLWALLDYAVSMVGHRGPRQIAYRRVRQRLGHVILLGLEVLIVGDIVRTIVVDPTIDSVAVLGIIVVIRIVLSFSLEVETDGVWPWNRWRRGRDAGDGEQEDPS